MNRKSVHGTCPVCLRQDVLVPLENTQLCDGCGMILDDWRKWGTPTTAAHLVGLCTKGRQRWPGLPMWRWPLLWWRDLGWTEGTTEPGRPERSRRPGQGQPVRPVRRINSASVKLPAVASEAATALR